MARLLLPAYLTSLTTALADLSDAISHVLQTPSGLLTAIQSILCQPRSSFTIDHHLLALHSILLTRLDLLVMIANFGYLLLHSPSLLLRPLLHYHILKLALIQDVNSFILTPQENHELVLVAAEFLAVASVHYTTWLIVETFHSEWREKEELLVGTSVTEAFTSALGPKAY